MGCTRRQDKKNPIADFRPDDFIDYLTNNEVYFTDKDLERYEDYCTNYQDSVILRLLFIGVGGNKLSEIRNLKKEEVNFKNKQLRLINSMKEDKNGNLSSSIVRTIDVCDRTLELINGAIDEKVYQEQFVGNIIHCTELEKNNFVIRAIRTDAGNTKNTVDKSVINRRIDKVAGVCGLKKLNEKLIKHNVMVYTAYKGITDDKITSSDYKIIGHKFNVNSYHKLKGFVTLENVRETYGDFDLDKEVKNTAKISEDDKEFDEGKKG